MAAVSFDYTANDRQADALSRSGLWSKPLKRYKDLMVLRLGNAPSVILDKINVHALMFARSLIALHFDLARPRRIEIIKSVYSQVREDLIDGRGIPPSRK